MKHRAPVIVDQSPYPEGFVPRHIGNHCRHALFMHACRRTTVPICYAPRHGDSLYCLDHAKHPARSQG